MHSQLHGLTVITWKKFFLTPSLNYSFQVMRVVSHSSARHHGGERGSVFSVTSPQVLRAAAGSLKTTSSPGPAPSASSLQVSPPVPGHPGAPPLHLL